MKKLLFAVMAISMLAMTSCKDDEEVIPSLKGTIWTLTYDWEPLNPPAGDGTALVTFKANGTFEGSGFSGTWTQSGKDVTFSFTAGGNAVYIGTINGDNMSGTASYTPGPVNGEWSAVRY